MNPVHLFLIIVSLPLLLGGCGEKESVAEVKPELEGVNAEELEEREGIAYLKGSDTPYTGKAYGLHKNGQKMHEVSFKGGHLDGLGVTWHENGQKKSEVNYKDGKGDGLLVEWYKNGQKERESNWKNGKLDGLIVGWHENGQKRGEGNYKDGLQIDSSKYWNRKGEPVDTIEEAKAE